MKKRYYLLMIGALAATAASARQLDPQEALDAVYQQHGQRMVAASSQSPQLVFTARQGDFNTAYVFNREADKGFIVVSADDAGMPLLGYSDSGSFDPNEIPPQLQWLLDEYGRQLEMAEASADVHPTFDISAPADDEERDVIPPLCLTVWSQGAPFNDDCPELTYGTSTGRAASGCVATAMAQVMAKHKWPVTGTGSNSYQFAYGGNVYSQSMDFATTTFDWDNMVNNYAGNKSAAQKAAVATLMHACGVAVNMSYGLAETGGSGANSFRAAQALVQYLGYDNSVQYCMREFYTADEWNDLIYNELAEGRPVMLSGRSDDGGHEFVCDGYSSDDFFHINWGWWGSSDGYFLLSALNPETQGIGGSSGGYTMSLDAIIGIQPPKARAVHTLTKEMCLTSDFKASSATYAKTAYLTLGSADHTGAIYNYSVAPIKVTLGVKLVMDDGSVSYIPSASYSNITLSPGQGYFTYSMRGADFPEGNYKVYPAFFSDDQWCDILEPVDDVHYLNASVNDSQIKFSLSDATTLDVEDISLASPIYIGQMAKVTARISATGDYYGSLRPILVSGGSVYGLGDMQGVAITPGEPATVEWDTDFTSNGSHTLVPGQYDLYIANDNGKTIGYIPNVTVNAAQTDDPEVETVGVEFSNADGGNGTFTSPYLIEHGAKMTVTIEGVQGYWADNVKLTFFDANTGASVAHTGVKFASVEEGRQTTVEYSELPELTPGTEYAVALVGNSSGQLPGAFTYVKIDTPTGVEMITAATDDDHVEVYTLNGLLVATTPASLNTLPAGTYVVKTAAGAKVVKK